MCKDDAVSTLLYLTPGKQNLFVEGMAEGRAKQGPSGSFACIAVRCNATEKKGKAAIVHLIIKKNAIQLYVFVSSNDLAICTNGLVSQPSP